MISETTKKHHWFDQKIIFSSEEIAFFFFNIFWISAIKKKKKRIHWANFFFNHHFKIVRKWRLMGPDLFIHSIYLFSWASMINIERFFKPFAFFLLVLIEEIFINNICNRKPPNTVGVQIRHNRLNMHLTIISCLYYKSVRSHEVISHDQIFNQSTIFKLSILLHGGILILFLMCCFAEIPFLWIW